MLKCFRCVSGDGGAFRGVSLASRWGEGCSSKGRSDAEGSQRRRQRDRKVRNRQRKSVDVPVIKVVQLDPQERVEETTAESASRQGHGSC